tara:strand:- start:5458 stop:6108 length:651 start_codon:yes stop_codon:yes gene_type:complete
MSLALTAASFDSVDNNSSNNNSSGTVPLHKRRTIKNRNSYVGADDQEKPSPKVHADKVSKVLSEMHINSSSNDGKEGLANFEPLGPPTMMRQPNREKEGDKSDNLPQTQEIKSAMKGEVENDNDVSPQQYAEISQDVSSEYANQYVPYFTNASDSQNLHGSKDVLLEKLNYMIHLLEEQKDEKTNHITEEVVLYCFLGVFVIFVTDSFARAGKYTR